MYGLDGLKAVANPFTSLSSCATVLSGWLTDSIGVCSTCSFSPTAGRAGLGRPVTPAEMARSSALPVEPLRVLPNVAAHDRLRPSSLSLLRTCTSDPPDCSSVAVCLLRRPGSMLESVDVKDGDGGAAAADEGDWRDMAPSPKPYVVVPGVEGDKVRTSGK